MIEEFPPLENADEDGLLAVGGDLELGSLLLAYKSGIFPWPIHSKLLAWFSPPRRAVLRFNNFHISRSLEKELIRTPFTVECDKNFKEVISRCASRHKKKGTWITPAMITAYTELHHAGYAHSVECYHEGNLVGGVYGVCLGKFFAAESMFYEARNASKIALVHLVKKLESQGGSWIDLQVLNPFTRTLGGEEILREDFVKRAQTEMQRERYHF